MGIFAVLLDFLFIWATKRSIDVATGTTEGSLVWAVVLLGSSMLATILLSYASSWVSALLCVKSNNKMRLRTFSQLMRRVWGGKDDLHSGDIMNRLMTDSARVTSVITDTVPAIVTVLFRLAGAFLFLFSMQRKLALILLFIAPAFLLASRLYVRRMRHLSKEIRTTESRIQSIVQENIQNRMVMQTFEQTDEAVKLLSNTQDYYLLKIRTLLFAARSQVSGIH